MATTLAQLSDATHTPDSIRTRADLREDIARLLENRPEAVLLAGDQYRRRWISNEARRQGRS